MGFSISSGTLYQLKSRTLRTNEEFVRLYNDATEAFHLKIQSSRALDYSEDFVLSLFTEVDKTSYIRVWDRLQERITDVDRVMRRAEKNAEFSEVLAGIVLQFEQETFPILRRFRLRFEYKDWFITHRWATNIMIAEEFLLTNLLEVFAECVSSELESTHKVVVSALVLLSFVYQYLIGCVDKGGSKTYSSGSFLFRLIFVAIVLFLGSYVWIKFRQASYTASRRKRKSCHLADRASELGDVSDVPEGVYRRAVKNTRGLVTHYKYEPRFKPRREKLESGSSLEFNYLPLGSYDTPREAEIVRHIAAVLYGNEEGRDLQFEDGHCLPFPSVTKPENCPPSGKEKADWVTDKTKELYEEVLEQKTRVLLLPNPGLETGSHHGRDGGVSRSDPSPSALGAPSTAIELTCFPSPHGGNGVGERATSESHGLGQEPLLAREVFSAFFSDSDFDQVVRSMPHLEENEFPAIHDLCKIEGAYSETDRVFGFECTLVPPQSSALDIPTSAIFASLPQLGGGDQGLEIIAPHLNSATAIRIQQLESLPEQVQLQQRVICQENRPEEFSGSNVELQQKLLESELLISELQQKLRKSEVENEKWRSVFRQWRSMFRQLAKLISASDEDGSPVDLQ